MHVMDRHRHRTVACAACVRMRCAFTHAMKMCSVDESDHLKKNGLEQTYFSLRPLSGLIILWLCFIAIQLAVLIQFYELILGGKFSGPLTYNIRVWIKQNRDFCFSSSISQLVLFIYLLCWEYEIEFMWKMSIHAGHRKGMKKQNDWRTVRHTHRTQTRSFSQFQ